MVYRSTLPRRSDKHLACSIQCIKLSIVISSSRRKTIRCVLHLSLAALILTLFISEDVHGRIPLGS